MEKPMTDQLRALERQKEIFTGGMSGARPEVPVSYAKLEEKALTAMSHEAAAYVVGGAGTESTIVRNRRAFSEKCVIPKMLSGIERVDTSVEIFGDKFDQPFLLSPIGVLELVHQRADLEVAQAAENSGVPMVYSNQASFSMETCSKLMPTAPKWFQLYWSKSNALVKSFVRRAENCGCSAIVLTLDTTLLGWRPQDLDLAYLPFLEAKGIAQYTSDPVFNELLKEFVPDERKGKITAQAVWSLLKMCWAYPGSFWKNLKSGRAIKGVQLFTKIYSRPGLGWDDLTFLRSITELPIVLKGIVHPEDAKRAIDEGIDGIWVSNHGGRQVDGAVSSFEMLPKINEVVAGRVPIIFDSGVRTGADAFKALACGATLVGVGRPYVYGLTLNGSSGVKEVLKNLQAELELQMALTGCKDLAEVRESEWVD